MPSERSQQILPRTQPAVVVERATRWHRPVLWWYHRQGYRICYLRVSPTAAWVRRTPWMTRLELREPVYWGHHPGGDLAFEVIDGSYAVRAGHPVIRRLVTLFDSTDIHLAFKKSMCAALERYAFYGVLRRRIAEALPAASPWMFVPAAPHEDDLPAGHPELARALGTAPAARPWWVGVASTVFRLLERARWLGLALLATAEAATGVVISMRPRRRARWQYAIAIVSPGREFINDLRGIGFLLDGARLRSDNTLFVPLVRLPSRAVETIRQRGLTLASMAGGTLASLPATVTTAAILGRYIFADPWLTRAAAHLMREYGRWQAFLASYHVDHFITYADFSLRQIGRNVLLGRDGTTTWYYADSVNTAETLAERPHKNPAWGWLYYDNFVSWCERFTHYFQCHPQRIGRYVEVGCLWSEHIRMLKTGTVASELRHRLPWSPPSRIIAVFDSTYRDDTATTYGDGVEFARGILRLLKERADLCVVWKEKKPREYHRGRDAGALAAAYDQLERHPRCLFTGHALSASEPLAMCELAISFPFTSPTLEALAAGVKAIYFDPSGKYRESYYARIGGLVAHGYESLRRRVDELLDSTTPDAYEAYLERWIRGAIDPFMDGLALTRFRALLAGEGLVSPVTTGVRS